MVLARVLMLATVVNCLLVQSMAFVIVGVGPGVRVSGGRATNVHVGRRGARSQPLRAASDDGEEGGFVNPYTAFRKWQMELIDSKARSDPKFEDAVAGLMTEKGMTKAKAERLAKLAVSDPILYSMERKREASELNNTPMDYSKIGGFFPMEWLLSGDFGWGFNKKKAREADEAAKNSE